MTLPFTADQFFDLFGAYNRALWPAALVLWLYALAGAVVLARHSHNNGRWIAAMLAVQWTWAGLVYHAIFFTSINPAAWLFSAAFAAEAVLFIQMGVLRNRLEFSSVGSARHFFAWMLIGYALLYPVLGQADALVFPRTPTFGVPCPVTLLTIGFLFAVDPPLPRTIAIIPILWAFVAGSAAVSLGVHADLMLWIAGAALLTHVLMPRTARVIA